MSGACPANSVISSYIATEDSLLDVLRVVPYCAEHRHVWSPRLVTITLETCSQLDSLWKYEARQSPCVTKKDLSIADYFAYYGQYMAPQWLVFYGEEPVMLQPYEEWANATRYATNQYAGHETAWWGAYNALKHNRLENQSAATLEYAIRALAGLFLAILRCEFCRNAVAQTDWLRGDGHNIQANLGEGSPSVKSRYITAESRLFTYALGWGNEGASRPLDWEGPCSQRFADWVSQR